ncbi:PH domain-containing protein [Herbiconiux sp. KACC 21604]|uniref:PH domain-containing protein n=1 Tax=unclassified Herbiconiux TaxID=2618217 RepID=UPI001492EEBC|nr:PH domain-containing protein [Herbiconiux sp. SALV-R1]QJU52321.1 PH domain-containing protein [Herbiconiux sp. SALV-R1]WPO87170.1 PH domain-containing protein [Herbiconiux sp. KACC 21604]
MTEPTAPGDPAAHPRRGAQTELADGEWHRLHPATPLLRGGIILVAILGFALANFRERLIDWVFGAPELPGDPFEVAYQRGQLGWVGLAIVVGLIVGIAGFYLSWRMHTFRVGDEVVEVRSGILFRTHRRARLDRIQGVAISRPVFARLFGAAKLDISVAGQDAKVQLAYLGSAGADELRRAVLLLASGARAEARSQGVAAPAGADAAADAAGSVTPEVPGVDDQMPAGPAVPATGAPVPSFPPAASDAGIVNQRVREFLAPELDPDAAPPESVVRIRPGRLIGSLLLSGFTVALVAVAVFLVVMSVQGRREFFAILIIPGLAAAIGYYFNRFTKSLRYSIAATPDGVRVGFGLLSTSNDTVPPGRIHAIEVSQPLLWRPAGWWMIRINRAGAAGEGSAQTSTTMLPVGTLDDVRKVLGLLLPGLTGETTRELVLSGLVARAGEGFTDSPRRAWPLRPLSWRRTGFAVAPDAVLLRSGFVWRKLVVVPWARVQSIRVSQGPVERMLDLVTVLVHTVSGPVRAAAAAVDRRTGTEAFENWTAAAVAAAASDRSHRWAEGER